MKKLPLFCAALTVLAMVSFANAAEKNKLTDGYGRKTIKLAAEPMVVGVGETATLTALLSDRATGTTVTFSLLSGSATFQGTFSQSDANGNATFAVTLPAEGSATFIAKANGYKNSNTVTILSLITSPKVKIDSLVRSGPSDIPNSIPPGRIVGLNVTIEAGFLQNDDVVELAIENADPANNGQAEIVGTATLTANGQIQVKGGTQTAPGFSGKIRIVARKNGIGSIIGASAPFSVCAHPTNFAVNGIYQDKNALRYGMIVVDRWNTDAASGDTATLDKIWQAESVKQRSRNNPPWHMLSIPFFGGTWVFDPGLSQYIIWFRGTTQAASLTYASVPDLHHYPSIALDNPPTLSGSVVYDQHFHFACERCRAGYVSQTPTISGSDFSIAFDCFKNGRNEYVAQTTKDGNGAPAGGLKGAVEAAQAPNAPSGVGGSVDLTAPDAQVFTVTWNDNSDIEDIYEVWYWDGAAWLEAPDAPLAPNANQVTLQFAANTFNLGDTLRVKVRAHNWRGDSAAVEGTIALPPPPPPPPAPDDGGGAPNP